MGITDEQADRLNGCDHATDDRRFDSASTTYPMCWLEATTVYTDIFLGISRIGMTLELLQPIRV